MLKSSGHPSSSASIYKHSHLNYSMLNAGNRRYVQQGSPLSDNLRYLACSVEWHSEFIEMWVPLYSLTMILNTEFRIYNCLYIEYTYLYEMFVY